MAKRIKQGSALGYVIEALIPFSDANLNLTFKPSQFFRELAEKTGKAESSLKNALVKAKKDNLLVLTGSRVHFENEAMILIERFKKLEATPLRSGYVLVLFDIPQSHDYQRRLLVRELKALRFKQIQKSVWASDHDNRDVLLDIVSELKIGRFVAISLTHPVFGSHHFD
ncbi:MAG: hypothetical protein U0520_00480 [Candidatus Saccharimonadales bacterium]